MRRVQPFTVVAELPATLQPLRDISLNLWWSWHHPAKGLFRRISREGFVKAKRNPIPVIESLSAHDIAALSKDKGYLAQIDEVMRSYESYRSSRYWWSSQNDEAKDLTVAYFSAEFGIHESVPIYSGGLGVLAGDHLKAASDLGVPIVAVGLLYYEGYFSQYLNTDGWQQESFPQIDINRLPLRPALGSDGKQIIVSVPVQEQQIRVRAWQLQVGLITLYLLDTNFEENDPLHRNITSRLYGGDVHVRIPQEIVLGIGGLRVLSALGVKPDVCHMNEGHSAFLALEQMRMLMASEKLNFEQALLGVRRSNLFTTHTMVPAGNDVFSRELIERYFSAFSRELGVSMDEILALGRVNPHDASEPFSMTVLAMRCSQGINGVSELHGHVSRKLWQSIWPELPLDESPIQHITNGVHTLTWTSRDMTELFDRYLGPNWRNLTQQSESWSSVEEIPDEEIWRIKCRSRSTLVTFCRERSKEQLARKGAGRVEIENASQVLDPNALTIGFARRFASYKRATLILRDIDRLVKIISDADRPVQFIFSGKAHPADQPGKELIARVIHASHRPELRGRVLFIEDYDMAVARKLVQGVDVWLNNPRRPLEASGTSGMKVIMNGGLNMSILDGWWCEAFDGENGWCIGLGEEYEDQTYQDQIESRSIYDLLEREIIPTFFDRTPTDVPKAWMKIVKHSMMSISPRFSASRMVSEYANRFYIPLGLEHRELARHGYDTIRSTHATITKLRQRWQEVRVVSVETDGRDHLPVGGTLPIRVVATLGSLTPEEVAVEVRMGELDAKSHLHQATRMRLTSVQPLKDGLYQFDGQLKGELAGSFGYSVRLIPLLEGKPQPHLPGLLTWWS